MKIGKVTLRNGGLKGLKVQYVDTKKVGTFDFLNEHDSKFSMPVVGALRTKMEAGYEFVKEVLRLKKTIQQKEIHILSVEGDGEKLRFTARVDSFDGCSYDVTGPWIDEATFYENKNAFFQWFEDIVELTAEYIERGEVINARQFVMEFAHANPKDKGLSEIDFENVDDAEMLQRMRECLEKKGHVILSQDDFANAATA